MRSRLVPAAIVLTAAQLSMAVAFAAEPGQIELAAFRGTTGVSGLSVTLDGKTVGSTNEAGKLSFVAGTGLHQLVLSDANGRVAFTEFRLAAGEASDIAVALRPQGEAQVDVDTYDTRQVLLSEVSGKVETAAGSPALRAKVTVLGQSASTQTDATGAFSLKLPRGSYTLRVDYGGVSQQFSGVNASPLLASALRLQLNAATNTADTTALKTVVVRAPLRRSSAASQERLAQGVVDTVTLEEIAIAGDSNAGDALKRVTGVTVQGDIIVVRGLGDRYSTTLLNGAEIPSPNPSRRVVSLDIFPTELLGGLTVQKTYTANLPGDFSGGVALIESRPVPKVNKGSIELKTGGNTRSTFANTLTYRGSTGDNLGYDSGIRDIPTVVNDLTSNGATRIQSLSSDQRLQSVNALPNIWDLRLREDTAPDFGVSAGYGGNYQGLEAAKIGYQLTGFYDAKTRFRRETRNELRPGQGQASTLDAAEVQRSDIGIDTGVIGNLTAEFDRNNRVDLVSLLSRNTEKSAFFTEALYNENFSRQDQRTTLDFIESQLLANQLTGRHRLPELHDLELKWQAGYSLASRDVLDRRSYALSRNANSGDGLYRLAINSSEGDLPQRDWEFLDDNTLDLGLEGALPLQFNDDTDTKLSAGVRATRKSREFDTLRISYFNPGAQQSDEFQAARLAPSPEQILVQQFFGTGGFDIRNANTQGIGGGNSEAYTGDHDIDAVFLSSDTRFGDHYKADIGVRVERSKLNVVTGDPRQGQTSTATLEDTNVLPAVNLTWLANKEQQVRLAYSKTVNRPQLRELADVQYLDSETRYISFGNPSLQQAEIDNYDLRFEQYWSSSQAVSLALFYKNFKNPIEATIQSDSSGRAIRSFVNSSSAKDYGVELDGRYGLDALKDFSPLFSQIYVAGNFSYIESEVDLPNGGSRKLQGQSPYIINFTLGYSDPGKTDAVLLFNLFGDRLSEVGFDGLPDAKEKSYPLLDFNLRHTFNANWRAGLKLRNLLDPKIEVRQANLVQRSYKLGTSGQLSVEYQF
jgi:outer membrane receptor protein involved in Fe transport